MQSLMHARQTLYSCVRAEFGVFVFSVLGCSLSTFLFLFIDFFPSLNHAMPISGSYVRKDFSSLYLAGDVLSLFCVTRALLLKITLLFIIGFLL